jgi:integrase
MLSLKHWQSHVEAFLQTLQHTASYNTVRRYRQDITMFCKLAAHKSVGLLPTQAIGSMRTLPLLPPVPVCGEEDEKQRVFTAEEIRAMYKHCKNERQRLFLMVLFTTGMRVGGVRRCRFRDFVLKGKARQVACSTEKGDKPHRFLVCEEIQQYITRNMSAGWVYLFERKVGVGRPLSIPTLQRHFAQIQRQAGVSYKSLHCSRHTVVYSLRLTDRPAVMIQAFLGHRSAETTQIYGVLRVRDVAAQLALPWLQPNTTSTDEQTPLERGIDLLYAFLDRVVDKDDPQYQQQIAYAQQKHPPP